MMENKNDSDIEGERGLEKALGKIKKNLNEFKEEVKKRGNYKDFIIMEYHPANLLVVGKTSIDGEEKIRIDISRFYNENREKFKENGFQ